MGGPGAPDNLEEGYRTQAWLAVSQDPEAMVTGECFYHQKVRTPHPAARDVGLQERLLEACRGFSGVELEEQ